MPSANTPPEGNGAGGAVLWTEVALGFPTLGDSDFRMLVSPGVQRCTRLERGPPTHGGTQDERFSHVFTSQSPQSRGNVPMVLADAGEATEENEDRIRLVGVGEWGTFPPRAQGPLGGCGSQEGGVIEPRLHGSQHRHNASGGLPTHPPRRG